MGLVSNYLRSSTFIPTNKWRFQVIIKQLWQQLQLHKVKHNNNRNKFCTTIRPNCIPLSISNI